MKRASVILILCMLSSILLFCGCARSNNSDQNSNVTSKPTNKPLSILTNTPTTTIAPTISTEMIAKAQEAEKQKSEAIQVIKDYFVALKEHDKRDPIKYLADRLKHGNFSNIKDAELISISDKDGRQISYTYKVGAGADTRPYKVISLELTYKILYRDEKKGSGPGGEYTKWFTLVKEKETSPWLIADIGY